MEFTKTFQPIRFFSLELHDESQNLAFLIDHHFYRFLDFFRLLASLRELVVFLLKTVNLPLEIFSLDFMHPDLAVLVL